MQAVGRNCVKLHMPEYAAVRFRVDVAAARPHTGDHIRLLGGLSILGATRVLTHLASKGRWQVRGVAGEGRWQVRRGR